MANSNKKKSSFKKFWEAFKIRMQLLKLWFLKNLSVIIKTTLVVILVLILVNVIDGRDFLPLFGVKSDELETVDWSTVSGIKNILASLGSIGFSIYVFLKKTKSLAIEDIKSKELKIALIRARLYFNENGKLCKRIEEASKMDLDGDGKIADIEINNVENENLLTGIPRAIGELTTILTTKIDVDSDEEPVVQDAQLNEEIQVVEENIEEKLYSEQVGAPDTEDFDDSKLDEKVAELQAECVIKKEEPEEVECEKCKTKKKKRKKRHSFIYRFFYEFFRAFRASTEKPEFNDNFETKKKVKDKKEKKTDDAIQDNVEVVNDVVESEETVIVEESTTTVSNQETSVIEPASEVVETTTEPVEEKIENKPVIEEKKQQPKQETVKASAKKQQYDDWINSIK